MAEEFTNDREIADSAAEAATAEEAPKDRSAARKEAWRAAKFVMFSISAGVIEILVFTLMNELLNLPYWPCYLTALVCSVLWNFTFNRAFTFRSANNVPVAMAKVFAYYCVFTPLTTIGGNYLAETLGWNEYLVTGINMALNLTTEYLYQRFVVFGKSLDTRKKKQ
ncbi:MAG: GtrA family protein [Eggerthellaceae bacterium]|nr:GtrA family protein [Eggerthellaceae bacterium]